MRLNVIYEKLKTDYEKREKQERRSMLATERTEPRKAILKELGKVETLRQCIDVERTFCQHYMNTTKIHSVERDRSFKNTHDQINGAELTLLKIQNNPKEYIKTAKTDYSTYKTKINDLPKDQVRLFLRSQIARITNERKSYLDKLDLDILAKRRENLIKAEHKYKELQAKTLNIQKKQQQSISMSM